MQAWEDDFWNYISPDKIAFLRLKVAPLLRFVPGLNPSVAFFTSKMERFGLTNLEKKNLDQIMESIKEDVSLLPLNLSQVATESKLINDILNNSFMEGLTLEKIDNAKEALADLMKFKREKPSIIIELGLDDIIESHKWVVLKKDSRKVYVEEYRKKVEEKIDQLVSKHPTIIKLINREEVSVEDLIKLEETLETEFNTDEICLDEENMLKAFGIRVGSFVDFLKHILKLESLPSYKDITAKAFDAFILEHNYSADQSRFLRAVQSVFSERRKLELADLYEEPFTNFGSNAVEKLFTEEDIEDIILLTKKLAA